MRAKLLSTLGMLMFGDGMSFLVDPRGQIHVWSTPRAPAWYNRALDYLAERPAMCRALAAIEIAAAACLTATSRRLA